MLKIGEFSKLSMVSIRMLRHYDDIGLLKPRATDDFTGYRYYSRDQLPVAARIAALKEMGFGLAAVGEILKSYENSAALAEFLAVKRAEVQVESEQAARRLLLLETAINRLGKDESAMNYNVVLKTIPERYVASVRKVIPNYAQEGMLWGILMKETAPLKVADNEPCYAMAIFHDAEYKESDVDIEVQTSVKGSYKNTENVVFKVEPPQQVAAVTFKGGYEQMAAVNEALAKWVEDNGYAFAGNMFNIYHVSPGQTQNPEEYVTEACCAVKKK